MKLAIIGTGKIVGEALTAIREAGGIEIMAIFARPHSRARGEELASCYGIPAVYTDYDELLSRADVDTVYIGLINSVHYEYAKRALEYGRNVILEKPFTGTIEEAEELFSLARENSLFIFEAITVLHNDIIDKMRETLPLIAPIRMMQANFSQYSSRYGRYLSGIADPSFDPECQGGALRDINIYNIHFAAALFGASPEGVYYPNIGFNGVDTSGVLILKYEGFSAVCTAAKDSDSPCFVIVQGENGYMIMNGKPNAPSELTTFISGAEEKECCYKTKPCHRMTREFADFAQMIDGKDHLRARYYEEETMTAMKMVSSIR